MKTPSVAIILSVLCPAGALSAQETNTPPDSKVERIIAIDIEEPPKASMQSATTDAEAAADSEAYETVDVVAIEEVYEGEYEKEYPTEPYLSGSRDNKIGPADYPVSSWQAGEEGTVFFSVTVSAEGKPTACEVTETSGFSALDAATCPLVLERAKFTPAYAAEDEPVEGIYEGRQRWRKREPMLPQIAITYRYTQGADGRPSDCEFLTLEGDLPDEMRRGIERDIEKNDGCMGPTRGIPYRDQDGNPIAKRVTVTFDVQLEDPQPAE